jgi:hypothetical protein
MTNIIEIQKEINVQLADKVVFKALVDTTFKGLEEQLVKRAIMEGMMRGFKFADFLEKNVYAIPFKGGYSLVTSIDYARKVGMRSGVCGKSEPIYEDDKDGNILSCKITIKRSVSGIVGEYTAKVFFKEYTTGFNLWVKKPRTMIAKVAEMHALRMACPEELAQAYSEEEMEKEAKADITSDKISEELRDKVTKAKTLVELSKIYKDNEGLGKEFALLVTTKKNELTKKKDEKNS